MKRILLLLVIVIILPSTHSFGQTAVNINARSLQLLGGTTDLTKTVTLVAPPTLTGAGYTLTFPNDDGAANQVLQTDGSGGLSWVTVSGGASLSGGTTNTLAVWMSATAIGNSSITDNGTSISLGSKLSVDLTTGTLSLQGTGSGVSSFKAGAQSSTINYTLPTSAPSVNQVLTATSVSGSGPYDVATLWAAPPVAYIGGNSGINTTSGDFYSPFGWGQPANETASQIVATRSGSLKNLYVKLSAAPAGATKSKTVTVRINGANTALAVTITNTATSGNNTNTTVTFAAGDLISINVTHANAPTASIVAWGFEMY